MESENVVLVATLNQLRAKLEAADKLHELHTQTLSREVQQGIQEVKNLKSKLEKTSDYDELKHELHLMRQIEFGAEEESEIQDDEEKNIDSLLRIPYDLTRCCPPSRLDR